MSVPAAPPRTAIPGTVERKILPILDIKARQDKQGGFEGYGAAFNNIDSYGDVIIKGAFAGTIEQFLVNGFASVGHAWSDLPVATFSEAREDDKGLFVVADFHSDDFSQRTRQIVNERVERGKSVGLSIGFMIKENGAIIGTDSDGFPAGVRIIKDIELFEVSVVNVPANPQALATGSKARYTCDDPTCGCRLGDAHHRGLKFADHGETLLAEVRGFAQRASAHIAMRAKQNRTPDEAQLERLTALGAELRDCLASIEGLLPQQDAPDGKENAPAIAEITRFELLRAQSLGVGVPE